MITKEVVIEKLKTVYDPHIGIDIYNIGLIYDIRIKENNIEVDMTLTTPACPLAQTLVNDAKRALSEIEGVGEVVVNLVYDPPWTPDMMSDELKKRFGVG